MKLKFGNRYFSLSVHKDGLSPPSSTNDHISPGSVVDDLADHPELVKRLCLLNLIGQVKTGQKCHGSLEFFLEVFGLGSRRSHF
jgi:hypothetical protein